MAFEFFKRLFKKSDEKVVLKKTGVRAVDFDEVAKFYQSYTQEKIDEIHSRGKITPYEKVEEWESQGLCACGDAMGSAADRCSMFLNCHECLLEFASHTSEYNKIDWKIVNTTNSHPLFSEEITKIVKK